VKPYGSIQSRKDAGLYRDVKLSFKGQKPFSEIQGAVDRDPQLTGRVELHHAGAGGHLQGGLSIC